MQATTPTIEFESLDNQQKFQTLKLKETLNYLADASPFYKKLFQKYNAQISSINTIEDLQKLPTTSKDDMQLFNQEFLCVSKSELVEYTSTSGTLGAMVNIALTKNDLDRLAYNEFLSFGLMNISKEDTVQLMLTLDRQFMAGMAYYLGLNKLGATSIRTGAGLPSMQIENAIRLEANTIIAVPTFICKLIDYCKANNIELSNLKIKKALCIGEALRNQDFSLNALGSYIQSNWDLKLFSTYASTEMQTAFTECEHGKGGHHHPELIILEILDDEGKQLPAGEFGEVTITTLGIEAMPLLRYRTGDICCYYDEPCECGRKTIRLSPVKGRKKQMIKFKGTTMYPPAIFEILNQCDYVDEYFLEVSSGKYGMDELSLYIHSDLPIDECEKLLKPFLQSKLRVIPNLHYISSQDIQQLQMPIGSRKIIKFVDKRN